jgi:hypothetical protein
MAISPAFSKFSLSVIVSPAFKSYFKDKSMTCRPPGWNSTCPLASTETDSASAGTLCRYTPVSFSITSYAAPFSPAAAGRTQASRTVNSSDNVLQALAMMVTNKMRNLSLFFTLISR